MIHLVRHGETEANATRVMQRPDVPLSARGCAQATLLARRLASAPVALVLASDLRRATETAAAIAAATGAPVELDAGLRERDFGDLRGTPYGKLPCDPFAPGYAPPGGETWEVFDARVDAAWARTLARAATLRGDLVVVTHGLVCAAVVRRHCDVPPGTDIPLAWGNTALTEVSPPRTLGVLGCVAHLAGASSDGGAV